MNKKKLVIASIGILVFLIFIVAYKNATNKNAGQYETTIIRKGDVIQKVLATGTLSPVHTVRICSQVPGIIRQVYVDYNSLVQKGQALALIDTREYEAELSRARSNVAAAEALSEKEDINCRQAESQLARTEALARGGAVPKSRYEEALATLASAKAQKKASVAQHDQAKAALCAATILVNETRIVSPMEGIVLSRNAEIGQSIPQAAAQELILFTIASDLSTMELRAEVSESDIGKVVPGQEVTFAVDAFPDTLFKGKVNAVRLEPIIDQKSVSYVVTAAVQNKDLLLKPSMTATIWIEIARKKDVLVVPSSALIEKDGRKYAEVLSKTAKRKEVQTGLKGQDGLIEIVSGLSEGDNLILALKGR